MIPILVGYDVLAKCGLCAPNEFQKYLCRVTSMMGFVLCVGGITFSVGFLAFEAETLQEYSENLYIFFTILNDSLYFVLLRWLCKDTFQLNQYYERIMKERKEKCLKCVD